MTKVTKPKMGRPRVGIEMETLVNLVRIQCTISECANVLNTSEDTIQRRLKEETGETFAAFFKRHQDEGKASLRRAQFKAATEDRQPTMLVWLGKQYLGQQDKVQFGGDPDNPIAFTVNYVRPKILEISDET
jgi:AraC-like DNA-binding protein